VEERRRSEDSRIDVLTERVENWMETTTSYRKELCSKLSKIQDKLDALPCDVRCEETKGIKLQLKALWAVTGGMVLAILSEWIKLK
jgi:hypothetical protein